MNRSCPICFDVFDEKSGATTDVCDHVFCFPCLQKWSKYGNFCPIDRRRFQKIINLESKTTLKVKPRKRKFARAFYDVSAHCEVCKISSNGDSLLLCDSCDLGYHCGCLTPPLIVIPNGRWHCPECVAVELRLRTNVATPADTKYAKNIQKKKRKKRKSHEKKTTGPNSRRMRIHYDQTRQSSRKDILSTLTKIRQCLKIERRISKDIDLNSDNFNSQNIDKPGPSKVTTSANNNSSYSINFDNDLDYSSDDEVENAAMDMNNAHQQEQQSVASDSEESYCEFDLEDIDFNFSSSNDSAAEDGNNRDVDKDYKQEELKSTMPPDDEFNYSSSEDNFFNNFNFDVTFSDESEKEDDQGVTSGNQQEELNTELAESDNSPLFSITNSDFETSSSEESAVETVLQHPDNKISNSDSFNQKGIEESIELRNNVSPQSKAKFTGNINDLSFDENQMQDVSTGQEISSPSLLHNDSISIPSKASENLESKDVTYNNGYIEERNQIEIEDRIEQRDNASPQSKDLLAGNFPDAIVLKLPLQLSLKRSPRKTSNDKDSFSHSSSGAVVKNTSDVSANFCKITAVSSCANLENLQNLESEPIVATNENVHSNKITAVSSCANLFQNLESEPIVATNENVHSNVDINKTNHYFHDTSSVRKGHQVEDVSSIPNHSSSPIPVIFSLIEKKISKLPHRPRVYSYKSFSSSKDKDTNSMQIQCASISNIGGTSPYPLKDHEARYVGQGNVCCTSPLTAANKASPSDTLEQTEFRLYAEESGKVMVPPNLLYLFKSRFFVKDVKHLSVRKDGALFLNWKHNS